jgi:hypothetical protein
MSVSVDWFNSTVVIVRVVLLVVTEDMLCMRGKQTKENGKNFFCCAGCLPENVNKLFFVCVLGSRITFTNMFKSFNEYNNQYRNTGANKYLMGQSGLL